MAITTILSGNRFTFSPEAIAALHLRPGMWVKQTLIDGGAVFEAVRKKAVVQRKNKVSKK